MYTYGELMLFVGGITMLICAGTYAAVLLVRNGQLQQRLDDKQLEINDLKQNIDQTPQDAEQRSASINYPIYSDEEYKHMKVPLLKKIAKQRGIKGYYRMNKLSLVSALTNGSEAQLQEISDEEWYPVTLEFTIPGTDNFHRIDCLDAKEEADALTWMREQCGEDFDDFEWK